MRRPILPLIMLVLIMFTGCDYIDDFFNSNLFAGMDPTVIEPAPDSSASIDDKQEYTETLVTDNFGSTAFFNTLAENLNSNDPALQQEAQNLLTAVGDVVDAGIPAGSSTPVVSDYQDTVLFQADIVMATSGAGEVSDNLVGSMINKFMGNRDATEPEEEDPIELVIGIVQESFGVDPENSASSTLTQAEFNRKLVGFIEAAGAFNTLGETINLYGSVTPNAGDPLNLAADAVLSTALAKIAGPLDSTGAPANSVILYGALTDPSSVSPADLETVMASVLPDLTTLGTDPTPQDYIDTILGSEYDGVSALVNNADLLTMLDSFTSGSSES